MFTDDMRQIHEGQPLVRIQLLPFSENHVLRNRLSTIFRDKNAIFGDKNIPQLALQPRFSPV